MTDDKERGFEKRAYENYRSEMVDLETVEAFLGERDVDDIEEYREPLSCDKRREVTLLLSWGGPCDGYKLYFDAEGAVLFGYYFYADWFEYQEFKLRDEKLDRVMAVYAACLDLQM